MMVELTNTSNENTEMSFGALCSGSTHTIDHSDLTMQDCQLICSGIVRAEVSSYNRCTWVKSHGLTVGDGLMITDDGYLNLDETYLKNNIMASLWWTAIKRVAMEQALNEAEKKGNLGEGTLFQKACAILGFGESSMEAQELRHVVLVLLGTALDVPAPRVGLWLCGANWPGVHEPATA